MAMLSSIARFAALLFLVLKPFLYDFYIIPGNSMAPTLLGPHRLGVCPSCGKAFIIPFNPDAAKLGITEQEEVLGICTVCRKAAPISVKKLTVYPGDRFLVNKVSIPRRWDLVVFPYPTKTSMKYVKRLIGLPGEEVVIKDGAVWINGKKIQPPTEIAGLQFTAKEVDSGHELWGSEGQPAQLGSKEYFVVGDFMARSADSRYWGKDRPVTQIEGVVSLIYWPLTRWRTFP